MELFNAILPNLVEILTTLLVALGGYLGIFLKKWLAEKTALAQQEFKREQWELIERIIGRTVQYVEQVAKELGSEEKLNKAKMHVIGLATEQGIELTEQQLTVVTEALVNEFYPHIEEAVADLTDGVALPLKE